MANTPKKVTPMIDPTEALEAAPVAIENVSAAAASVSTAALAAAPAGVKDAIKTASAPIIEMQNAVRKAVEKNVTDSRAAYARVKTAADEAASALESSVSTVSKGVIALNNKALDTLRANADANFDFLKALVNAKTVSEALSLQSEHARKQSEAFAAQMKEFGALAQKVTSEASEPLKTQVSKSFKLAV